MLTRVSGIIYLTATYNYILWQIRELTGFSLSRLFLQWLPRYKLGPNLNRWLNGWILGENFRGWILSFRFVFKNDLFQIKKLKFCNKVTVIKHGWTCVYILINTKKWNKIQYCIHPTPVIKHISLEGITAVPSQEGITPYVLYMCVKIIIKGHLRPNILRKKTNCEIFCLSKKGDEGSS